MRQTLEQWLDYIGGLHPIKWDLTLDRVAEVARRLGVVQPARRVILVAGTNGKGSCCQALAALATGAGVSFGVTTSPHLRHFNERIQINGAEATDLQIVSAFEQIELARSDISLSYFEFACLAALLLFKEADLDLAILEIGLGGRLDAMNLVDPDISVILPIALDHQSYLGDTLEAIGLEKAGILRPNGTLVLADPDPPNSILAEAARQRCQVKRIGREFDWADGEVSWMAAELQQSLTLPSAEKCRAVVQCLVTRSTNPARSSWAMRVFRRCPQSSRCCQACSRAVSPRLPEHSGGFRFVRRQRCSINHRCDRPDGALLASNAGERGARIACRAAYGMFAVGGPSPG